MDPSSSPSASADSDRAALATPSAGARATYETPEPRLATGRALTHSTKRRCVALACARGYTVSWLAVIVADDKSRPPAAAKSGTKRERGPLRRDEPFGVYFCSLSARPALLSLFLCPLSLGQWCVAFQLRGPPVIARVYTIQ